jgi:hypothetical protein
MGRPVAVALAVVTGTDTCMVSVKHFSVKATQLGHPFEVKFGEM